MKRINKQNMVNFEIFDSSSEDEVSIGPFEEESVQTDNQNNNTNNNNGDGVEY